MRIRTVFVQVTVAALLGICVASCSGDQTMPPGSDASMDGGVGDGSALVDAPRDTGGGDAHVGLDAALDANPDSGPTPCSHDTDCTAPDLCHSARCVGGTCQFTAASCSDTNPCTQDVCDPATGNCSNPPATDGTTCSSGMCCGGTCQSTQTDPMHCGACGTHCGANATCSSGTCACNTGFLDCDGATGCEANSASDPSHCGTCTTTCSGATPTCLGGHCGACSTGADCPDDGLACTAAATCTAAGVCNYALTSGCLIAGACVAAGAADPSNACRVCDPATSTTQYTVHTGASCDDGSYCTTGDVCNAAGACVGTLRSCDDSLACTNDTCNAAMMRCDHVVEPGNCAIGGVCYSQSTPNPASPQCQVCDSSMSTSAWTSLTGLSCDDGLYCTVADTCTAAGACRGLSRSCDDLLACTNDACSEAMMACTHVATAGNCFINGACYPSGTMNPANQCMSCNPALATQTWSIDAGAVCNDGDFCTVADACTGTAVCYGQPRFCNDGLSCTTDTCDSANARCNYVPQTDFCLINGTCWANGTVNPGQSCQACVSTTSNTSWTARTGSVCDDGLFCTTPDTCTASGTCMGATNTCSDGISCTLDTCDEVNHCQHMPTAMSCTIGGTCYASGVQNPGNQCQVCTPSSSTTAFTTTTGASCSDGFYCTTGDQCTSSATCTGTAVNCDDGLTCTMDSCSEAAMGACVHAIAGGFCAISGACYANGAANPANPCQICNTSMSTTAWSGRVGACDDGNYCTTGDTCTGGSCVGMARSCDDGLSCTTDSCMQTGAGTGTCSNVLQPNYCHIGSACVADQTANPANGCQACIVATSTMNWSPWPSPGSHTCDDSQVNTCGLCTPAGMCGHGATCSDGLSCTNDVCVDASSTCQYPVNTGCAIGGVCYTANQPNPSNPCQYCGPSTSTTTWTPYPRATSCDPTPFSDATCMMCDGFGSCATSQVCNDGLSCTTDYCNAATGAWPGQCSAQPVAGTCAIAGACYTSGQMTNYDCLVCDPATSPFVWTPTHEGETCLSDSSNRTCQECQSGSCNVVLNCTTAGLLYCCTGGGLGMEGCANRALDCQ